MEKSPFIKKSPEIKSYQFETLFSRTFFLAPVWFYTKKSSEKKSSNKWKFMTLYWQPSYYFRKKKSHESKTQDSISSDIFSKDLRKFGLFSKVFISRFFSRNFFLRTFLQRFSELTPTYPSHTCKPTLTNFVLYFFSHIFFSFIIKFNPSPPKLF